MKVLEKVHLKKEKENKRCIVLFSGGIDSTILLFKLKKSSYDVSALTINYDKRNFKEIEATRKLAKLANIKDLFEVNLDFLKEFFFHKRNVIENYGNKLKDLIKQIPNFYIPARNGIFIFIAAYFAEIHNISYIFTGHTKKDTLRVPDVNYQFLKGINISLKNGLYLSKIKVRMPFLKYTKQDLVKIAIKYKVPIEYCWSCYSALEHPCNQCLGCIDRNDFFKLYEKLKEK